MANKNVADVFKDIDLKEVAASTSLTEKRIKEIVNDGDFMEPNEAIILADYAKIDAADLLNHQTQRTLEALKYKAPAIEKATKVSTQRPTQTGSARAMKAPGGSQF